MMPEVNCKDRHRHKYLHEICRGLDFQQICQCIYQNILKYIWLIYGIFRIFIKFLNISSNNFRFHTSNMHTNLFERDYSPII